MTHHFTKYRLVVIPYQFSAFGRQFQITFGKVGVLFESFCQRLQNAVIMIAGQSGVVKDNTVQLVKIGKTENVCFAFYVVVVRKRKMNVIA